MSTGFQWQLLRSSCQTIAYAVLLSVKSNLAIYDRHFANIRCTAVLCRAKETFVSFGVIFIVIS